MKLLTYDTGTGPRCGVLRDDQVLDVTALLGAGQTLRDVRALLELGDAPLDRVRDALARNVPAPHIPLAHVRLRSPVLQPPTVRDFMVFEEHATGQGTRQQVDVWYRMPIFYFSNTLRIFGPDETVPMPSASDRHHTTSSSPRLLMPKTLPRATDGALSPPPSPFAFQASGGPSLGHC